MGLLSWWKSKPTPPPSAPTPSKDPNSTSAQNPPSEIPGLNGAVEVRRRPEEVTVFSPMNLSLAAGRSCPLPATMRPSFGSCSDFGVRSKNRPMPPSIVGKFSNFSSILGVTDCVQDAYAYGLPNSFDVLGD
ncbi:uncharacterized protein A4U43_C03F9430 [Asparagus officinalis]|uniref:Uncharacterized protein n=1 Tax=Asparagus officinalis TaxID=4686 RepID=A0A5P1F8L1_ASPOF|nr:uncharacterized protein A4U43_C03F9430 [Asparagus officinalis]